MVNLLLILVVSLIGIWLIGLIPTFLIGTIYYVALFTGPIIVGAGFLISGVVIFLAFSWYRQSFYRGFSDVVSIGIVGIGVVISWFATAIQQIGSIVKIFSFTKGVWGKYLNEEFIEDLREELIELRIKRVEVAIDGIDESSEELVQEIREIHDSAGRGLSNGEVVLGLFLAMFAILPPNTPAVPYSEVITSPIVGASISVALIVTVVLRISVLDLVLISNPSPSEDLPRLFMYRDWNRGMTGNTKIVSRMLMFKVINSINPNALEFYIKWIDNKQQRGDRIGKLDLILAIWRPMLSFHHSNREGISPVEASKKYFGMNIFSQFDFGYGKNIEPDEDIPENVIDSILIHLIEVRNSILDIFMDVHRFTKVQSYAEEQDLELEEASMELYGENIIEGSEELEERD